MKIHFGIKHIQISLIVVKFQFLKNFLMHIQTNKSLSNHNSFHFDVMADYFVDITSVEDVQELVVDPIFLANKRLIV